MTSGRFLIIIPMRSIFEAELNDCDGQCDHQTADQNEKYAGHISQWQFVPRRLLAIGYFAIGAVIPPLVQQLGQLAVLNQRQNGQIDWHTQRWTERCGHPKSFAVQVLTHFHRIAWLPFVRVVIFRRFNQQCIFAFGVAYACDALFVRANKHFRMRFHVVPHFCVQWNGRFLFLCQHDVLRQLHGRNLDENVRLINENCAQKAINEMPITSKNCIVEPWYKVPYCTSFCEARSSGDLIGVTIRSTVRNAAKLAVYDETRINVKNHQTEPTMRPDNERGDRSQPCCMNALNANQNEFRMPNSLTAVPAPLVLAERRFKESSGKLNKGTHIRIIMMKLLLESDGIFYISCLLPGSSSFHSFGENRDTMKRTIPTPT